MTEEAYKRLMQMRADGNKERDTEAEVLEGSSSRPMSMRPAATQRSLSRSSASQSWKVCSGS